MNAFSLMNKINKDAHFGKDSDFSQFVSSGGGTDTSRPDSGLSNDSNSGSGSNDACDRVIVDLDTVIEKWIGWMWDKTKNTNKSLSKYEYEDLDIVVNWHKVDMRQDEAKFEGSSRNKCPTNQTLFRTYFYNNTDVDQEYSFKTERTTRHMCGFSFLKGFCREKDAALSFKLPQDILEIGGGVREEQSIECGKEQTKEDEVSWGVDNLIRVPPHTRASAELVISELQFDRRFSVTMYIKGRVFVTLNHKKENNAFVKSFSGDVVEIIRLALNKHWLKAGVFDIVEAQQGAEAFVKSTFTGVCKFRLGVEQHVNLNQEKLAPPTTPKPQAPVKTPHT